MEERKHPNKKKTMQRKNEWKEISKRVEGYNPILRREKTDVEKVLAREEKRRKRKEKNTVYNNDNLFLYLIYLYFLNSYKRTAT